MKLVRRGSGEADDSSEFTGAAIGENKEKNYSPMQQRQPIHINACYVIRCRCCSTIFFIIFQIVS
jgi:hypothetical protein